MADSTPELSANFRAKVVKVGALRLSDANARDTTDYAEILVGDGVPSGDYGRASGATMLWMRKDASSADAALYITVDGGTTWSPAQTTGAGGTQTDLIFPAATELTIASGAVTATQGVHTLDTEADAASDDLDTIAGGTAEEIIFVRPSSAARTVVLKHAIGANRIACLGGRDISLAEATDWAMLAYDGTQWVAVAASTLADGILATANTWTALQTLSGGLTSTGASTLTKLLAAASTELTIATGAIAATRLLHSVDTEADAASDDLDDITGGAAGQLLLVRPENGARTVVLRHAIGANKIACLGARNISLAEPTDWALLASDGTQWVVLAASTLADGILATANTWTALQTLSGGLTSTGTTTLTKLLAAASTELTIATGAIAAARLLHSVDTEADAASDDLDDITGGAAGQLLLLRPENGARTVVLKHAVGANKIACLGARNISLAEPTDWALLASDGTQWVVLAFSTLADGVLAATNSWAGAQTFQNILLGASSELTIATGAVAATRSYHTIDTEADAASDDLDDITGGATGEILLLRPENGARTVVIKHAVGANKIACPGNRDITMSEAEDFVLLAHNGTQWAVIGDSTGLIIGTDVQAYSALTASLITAAITPVRPILTAAAEAGNAIAVSIQIKNASGTNVSRVQRLRCQVYDASMVPSLVAAFTSAETGVGAEVSTTARPGLLIDTDANGAATVTVTDVSGSFVGTVYIEVEPVNELGTPQILALVFA